MKKIIALVLSAVLVFSMAGCAQQSAAPAAAAPAAEAAAPAAAEAAPAASTAAPAAEGEEVFRIATYLQLSGNNAMTGENAKKGIDLAAKLINENGGFNGATVVVDHYDTTGSPEEAVKIVQRVISDGNVDAIIGSVNSNEVSACISYINDAKIFNFGLGTSATWMEDPSMIYTFRASCNNNRIAPQDATMIKKMGLTKVAIINGTDDTGKSTADAIEAACKEQGLEVVERQECDSTDTDFTGQISKIMAAEPEIVFESLIGDTFGPFTKQLRNMGYDGLIGCKECFSVAYAEIAGWENANYIAFVYPYVPYNTIDECNIPVMKDFLEKFSGEYNGELPTHEAAYRGWDTMMSMWECSKQAGANDDESLREAMTKVKIDGLGGTLDFTKGDREGYSVFNEFILVDKANIPLDEWLAAGGMDQFK